MPVSVDLLCELLHKRFQFPFMGASFRDAISSLVGPRVLSVRCFFALEDEDAALLAERLCDDFFVVRREDDAAAAPALGLGTGVVVAAFARAGASFARLAIVVSRILAEGRRKYRKAVVGKGARIARGDYCYRVHCV